MDTAITVESLIVRRGKNLVLDGVSIQIQKGVITGLLGPSSSGKTTLMRAIVGVQIVESGRITVLGHDAGSPATRRTVGYVTQSPSIYPDLSVMENVRYFAAVHDLPATSAEKAILDVGLESQRDQLVRTLSGGQHSRASLACALVAEPEILILDEPTVGQDPLLREELWQHFHSLAKAGTTILVSSHVMDEANRCDHLVLIRDGEIIANASPSSVKKAAGSDDLDQAFLNLIRAKEGIR